MITSLPSQIPKDSLTLQLSPVPSHSYALQTKIHVVSDEVLTFQKLVSFFTGRQRSCKPCTSYRRKAVRLSVCLSVTRWHWVKKTQARITKSSPTDSPRTLVFGIKKSSRNSKGFTPSEGVKCEWGRKNSHFQPISRRISEMVQDRTKVTINH